MGLLSWLAVGGLALRVDVPTRGGLEGLACSELPLKTLMCCYKPATGERQVAVRSEGYAPNRGGQNLQFLLKQHNP